MSFWVLVFKLKENPPKRIGVIHSGKIPHPTTNTLYRSLASPCENCGKREQWTIVEVSTQYSLFFLPLGNSDYKYHVYCPACQHYIMQFGLKEYINLKKNGILQIEGKEHIL